MPATKLDSRTALTIIDLQKGIASIPCAHPMASAVSFERIFPRLGETGATQEIIGLLATRSA